MADDLTYWNDALAGKAPAIHPDAPRAGYFKVKLAKDDPWLPVVIFTPKDGGAMIALIGAGKHRRDATEIWTYAANKPVTKEAAMHAFNNDNHWPDMPAPVPKSNMPSDPFEALLAEIADKQAQAEALLAKGDAQTETECNLARNLQKQLLDLHKRADAMHTEQKAPVLKQEREIDERFRFRVPLKGVADRLREYWGKWAKAEEKRLQREADAKVANERRAIEAARREQEAALARKMADDPIAALTETPPELPELPAAPEPVKVHVGGGYGSRGGLRSVWVPTIADYMAALNHYAEHPDVKAVIEKLVRAETRTHKSATKIPGVTVTEDRKAA